MQLGSDWGNGFYELIRLDVKPLSVNEAWKGKRYKTDKYKCYEEMILWLLPAGVLIPKRIGINFAFGFSNVKSDLDNPVKLILDIMQKRYGFNDSEVWELNVKKQKVEVGKEFIEIVVFSV